MRDTATKVHRLSDEWIHLLGARRAALLQRLMRKSALPAEAIVDLALRMLELASEKLAPSPISRQAVGLGAARWRNVSPEERSRLMTRAVQARWAKQRREKDGLRKEFRGS